MADLKVTIEGPGQTFGGALLAIKDALEAIGCHVRVEDKHPIADAIVRSEVERPSFRGTHVVIEAKHCPWGG